MPSMRMSGPRRARMGATGIPGLPSVDEGLSEEADLMLSLMWGSTSCHGVGRRSSHSDTSGLWDLAVQRGDEFAAEETPESIQHT